MSKKAFFREGHLISENEQTQLVQDNKRGIQKQQQGSNTTRTTTNINQKKAIIQNNTINKIKTNNHNNSNKILTEYKERAK